jgi:hypothetical protein
MTAEISCDLLVAANDRRGNQVALGVVADIEAAVAVYAAAPSGGGFFEFAARVSSAPISPPPPIASSN